MDGIAKLIPLKSQITMIIKMNGLWDFVNTNIWVPLYPNLAVEHELKDIKVRCIFSDGVRDHIITHISWNGMTHLEARG